MSMISSAVLRGRRSPLYGQGYGSASTNRSVAIAVLSAIDAQLARRAGQRPARRAGDDHDPERDDVGRGVEQVIAPRNPDRLQRRSQRAGGAEEQRGVKALQRVPAGE